MRGVQQNKWMIFVRVSGIEGFIDDNTLQIKLLMMHQHNASTLLGYQRRAVYYPPDGSGRDNYIRTDNGGTNIAYRCQGVPELGNFMKFGPPNRAFRPCSYTRFQKYASDGTGRDQYVVAGHGGQYNEEEENSALLVKFRNTMRDGGWRKQTRNTATDFCRPSQIKAEQEMSRTQSVTNRRLSQPKRRSVNYLEKIDEMRKTFHKI